MRQCGSIKRSHIEADSLLDALSVAQVAAGVIGIGEFFTIRIDQPLQTAEGVEQVLGGPWELYFRWRLAALSECVPIWQYKPKRSSVDIASVKIVFRSCTVS